MYNGTLFHSSLRPQALPLQARTLQARHASNDKHKAEQKLGGGAPPKNREQVRVSQYVGDVSYCGGTLPKLYGRCPPVARQPCGLGKYTGDQRNVCKDVSEDGAPMNSRRERPTGVNDHLKVLKTKQ
jgi:hypothetical protein